MSLFKKKIDSVFAIILVAAFSLFFSLMILFSINSLVV